MNKILLVVQDFLKVHDQLEGKYWPMIEVFLERLEKDIPEKKISKDFYKAYMEAKQIISWEEIPNYWYKTVGRIQRIALMGRNWIERHRTRGIGFWSLLELANALCQEPKKKSRGKDVSAIKNKHFRYFLVDEPQEFPFLFASWTEAIAEVPNLEKADHKVLKYYEKMAIRLLDKMLDDSTFFFSQKHNWQKICYRILRQIEPLQSPAITDIETKISYT